MSIRSIGSIRFMGSMAWSRRDARPVVTDWLDRLDLMDLMDLMDLFYLPLSR
jgi:hypothetical protein